MSEQYRVCFIEILKPFISHRFKIIETLEFYAEYCPIYDTQVRN